MTIRRIAMQAATANLTAGKSTTVDVNGLLIDGVIPYSPGGTDVPIADGGTGSSTAAAARLALGLVDALDRMPAAMMPTKILNSYWHASFDERTVVAGTWVQYAYPLQTDYDLALAGAAGVMMNGGTNNEEVHFGNLDLNAGTYKISFCGLKAENRGIIEILHGTTSLGTYDLYSVGLAYNVVSSFTYSPTTRVTGNLRVKASGKNASSSAYLINVSRLEIIRTG